MNCKTDTRQPIETLRLNALIPLLWILAVVGCLIVCVPNTARAQSKLITEYTMDGATVEVPFVYVQHQIIVHGEAGGKTDLTLLFDTGASVPVFDSKLDFQGNEFNFPDATIQ